MLNNKSKKQEQVINIQQNFQNSLFTIFYDISNVQNNFEGLYDLRCNLTKLKSKVILYKNKIIEKALQSKYSDLKLKNSNALIFCFNEIEKYKVLNYLFNFNQKYKQIQRFKGALDNKNIWIEPNVLKEWSNLPSKEVLIQKLIFNINFLIKNFITILKKIN